MCQSASAAAVYQVTVDTFLLPTALSIAQWRQLKMTPNYHRRVEAQIKVDYCHLEDNCISNVDDTVTYLKLSEILIIIYYHFVTWLMQYSTIWDVLVHCPVTACQLNNNSEDLNSRFSSWSRNTLVPASQVKRLGNPSQEVSTCFPS